MLVDVWQPPSTFCNTLNFDEEVQCPQVVLKGHCIIIRNKQAPPCRAWLQYYEEKEDSDFHCKMPCCIQLNSFYQSPISGLNKLISFKKIQFFDLAVHEKQFKINLQLSVAFDY